MSRPSYLCLVACLAVCTVVILIGCRREQPQGNANPASMPARTGTNQTGYLAVSGGSVLFIRCTSSDEKMIGQLQWYSQASTVGGQSRGFAAPSPSSSHSLEGVRNGSDVSIRFTGSPWTDGLGGQTWTGTLDRKGLELYMPARDGTLSRVSFRSATVEDYNNAVASFQRASDEAAREAARRQAVVDAGAQVTRAANDLAGATGRLDSRVGFDQVLRDYGKAWQTMQADYQKIKAEAAKKPLDAYQIGQVEYALGTVEYDLGVIQYTRGCFETRLREANEAITQTTNGVAQLQKAWEGLGHAMASSPNTPATCAITRAHVSRLVQGAHGAAARASDRIRLATNQASAYDAEAAALCQRAKAFVANLKASGG